jgi:hypothetical protein
VNDYFSTLTGLPADEATKDPSRLSFLAFDADAILNPDSECFVVTSSPSTRSTLSAPVTAALSQPALSPAERAADILRGQGIAYIEGNRHRYLFSLACLMNKMGSSEEEIFATLAPQAPRGDGEARDLAHYVAATFGAVHDSWHKYLPSPARHRDNGDGNDNPAPRRGRNSRNGGMPQEIADFLRDNVRLHYNTVSGTVEVWLDESNTFNPMTDIIQNTLWMRCCDALGHRVPPSDFNDVLHSLSVPLFDPFLDYLDSLPPYDPLTMPDYIDQLAATVHVVDNGNIVDTNGKRVNVQKMFQKYFKRWFVGLLPPLLHHGTTNQTVLVFIGRQGIYKSTFFRMLLPPQLSAYFLAKTNAVHMDKDDRLAVCEFALICLEELDSMNDRELNQLKAIITTQTISERAAYNRNKSHRPHIASFCATGNVKTFLTDPTGNRRWLPFEVENILSPLEHPFNYDGIYSQALYLANSHHFNHWLDPDETDTLTPLQQEFTVPSPEEEQIRLYYRRPGETPYGSLPEGIKEKGVFRTSTQIMERCNSNLRIPLSVKKISQALINLGYTKRRRGNGCGFIVVERSQSEIDSENHLPESVKKTDGETACGEAASGSPATGGTGSAAQASREDYGKSGGTRPDDSENEVVG